MIRHRAFRPILAALAFATLAVPVAADEPSVLERWAANPGQIFDGADIDLEEFKWIARPLVVFANSPRDPAFVEQMEEITRELPRLIEREVIVVTDTDPSEPSDLRNTLRPRGFMLALIGMDGQIELRKPLPWTVRELSRTIDKMPVRQREMGAG